MEVLGLNDKSLLEKSTLVDLVYLSRFFKTVPTDIHKNYKQIWGYACLDCHSANSEDNPCVEQKEEADQSFDEDCSIYKTINEDLKDLFIVIWKGYTKKEKSTPWDLLQP